MGILEGGFLYVICAVVVALVLAQSIFFLLRAIKRGKQLGMSTKLMKDTAVSSATFSIVPSVPIVLAMVILAATLGPPFAWLRLSVIGSMTYETMAAGKVAEAAQAAAGTDVAINFAENLPVFASAMWVMTLGILIGPIFNIFGLKRYQKTIEKISKRDPKWSKILVDALFMGIIAVMGGQYIAKGIAAYGNLADPSILIHGQAQLLTLITGVVLMLLFGGIIKATKAKWLENFALPVSMVGAIALSVIYHGWF